MAQQNKVIEGKQFDSPLVLPGASNVEPQRYIAELPYELTKYEFVVLRRRGTSHLLFTSAVSATVGIALMLTGKFVSGVITQQQPDWHKWELVTLELGIVLSIVLTFVRSRDDKERERLEEVINSHFQANKPRRVHVTAGSDQ